MKNKSINSTPYLKSLFILFTFLSLLANGQERNVEQYYQHINKAELLLTEGKLDSSSHHFSAGFKHLPFPFSRHVFNAAVVDAQLKRYNNVHEYLKYLLQLGYPFDSLNNAPLFKVFFKTSEGKKLVAVKSQIKPIYNTEYRSAIVKMVEDDQFFRIKSGGYKLYSDTIRKIDKRNVDELLRLIDLHGFPSESKVGVDPTSLLHPLYSVIIIHQTKGPAQIYNFEKIVTEHMLQGNIENKAGFYLVKRATGGRTEVVYKVVHVKVTDPTKNVGSSTNHQVLESSDYGYLPESAEKIKKMNEERQRVYLDTHEENIKKVFFSLQFPQYKTSSLGAVEMIVHQDRQLYSEEKAILQQFKQ